MLPIFVLTIQLAMLFLQNSGHNYCTILDQSNYANNSNTNVISETAWLFTF